MKFSLILATVNRTIELEHFLNSLTKQGKVDLELIVVDQNQDDRLIAILVDYQNAFPIIHLRSERGLSKARNVGLKQSTGDILAFPDDDCWYPDNLLVQVQTWFDNQPAWGGLTGRVVDESGQLTVTRWQSTSRAVTLSNVWNCATSITLFLRREIVETVGGFDEKLGAGSGTPWGAGEDIDYPLRAIEAGFEIFYNIDVIVHHPNIKPVFNEKGFVRTRGYARGAGYVLRKHDYPFSTVFYHWLRPFGGMVMSLLIGRLAKARHHWNILLGRIEGYFRE
jgi:glycosyltransferase involved in cell wall biosynthesis